MDWEAVAAREIVFTGDHQEANVQPKLFFERPVVFRCKFCKWVSTGLVDETSRQIWLDEEAALQKTKLSPDDVWWFHTICDVCRKYPSVQPDSRVHSSRWG